MILDENMKISDLLKGFEYKRNFESDFEITGVEYDSRNVEIGNLFFCISGLKTDGHKFAPMAVEKGAAVLVVTRELELDIPQIIVEDDRLAMALLSCRFFGNPAKKLKMIGVTGTNGKTTITYMMKAMLEECGKKVGLVGTIHNMIGDREIYTSHTTPESPDLNRFMRDMLSEGCEYLVIEVSSHSLDLKRVAGIEFDVGIFTNLTQDHLDYHKNFENYSAAKAMLFASSKVSILNMDDKAYVDMEKASAGKVMLYGTNTEADFSARNIYVAPGGTDFDYFEGDEKKRKVKLRMTGDFNALNALSAIITVKTLNIDFEKCIRGLERIAAVDGRCQVLDTEGRGFSVILDYAHTPDSLESTISSVRGFAKKRIITVFGCGGNRDEKKRPIMGEISGRLSDFSIITSDNPRNEDPNDIIREIKVGMEETDGEYTIIENRREAIKFALEIAEKDDIVILAGKGHETYQEIKDIKYDFDEKIVIKELLEEI